MCTSWSFARAHERARNLRRSRDGGSCRGHARIRWHFRLVAGTNRFFQNSPHKLIFEPNSVAHSGDSVQVVSVLDVRSAAENRGQR